MRRRPRIAAMIAAMTVALGLALGGTAIAGAGIGGQHAQPAGMAGAGQTASRSAVPWSKVGPGWALVTYTTANLFTSPPKAGATTLYLVDPAGGKYVMDHWTHVPANGGVSLVAWSGDRARAMLSVTASGTGGQLDQLTLATGKLTRLPLPASAIPISYTRPDGLAVLAYRIVTSPTRVQLVRYNLSGGLEKVLYTQKTGSSGGEFVNGGQSPYSPDGTAIALTAVLGGNPPTENTVLISNAGGAIRRFTSADSCFVARWWTASQLLTQDCAGKRLFVTPVSGAKPVPVAPASTSPYLFQQGAWLLSGHVYVEQTGPACGTGSVSVVRGGRLDALPKVPGGAIIVTTSTSRLLIVSEHCMGSSGLLWFNPANSARVQVLGQNQGQGVSGFVPYYKVSG